MKRKIEDIKTEDAGKEEKRGKEGRSLTELIRDIVREGVEGKAAADIDYSGVEELLSDIKAVYEEPGVEGEEKDAGAKSGAGAESLLDKLAANKKAQSNKDYKEGYRDGYAEGFMAGWDVFDDFHKKDADTDCPEEDNDGSGYGAGAEINDEIEEVDEDDGKIVLIGDNVVITIKINEEGMVQICVEDPLRMISDKEVRDICYKVLCEAIEEAEVKRGPEKDPDCKHCKYKDECGIMEEFVGDDFWDDEKDDDEDDDEEEDEGNEYKEGEPEVDPRVKTSLDLFI